jgi:hypothetical protein
MNTHQRKLGKQFLSHAVEFIRASQRLRSQKPFLYHPTFYCALHGLELALKSHLAADGFSKARLAGRKLGHDLDSLLTHALKCGSVLQPQLIPTVQRIVKAGSNSYARKCFEYPEFFVTTVHIDRWIALAERIIRSADEKLDAKCTAQTH